MRVAIYSRTPLAAAPFELWKALRKYTDVHADLINLSDRYPDGRIFPRHLLAKQDRTEAEQALLQADVWHINNYWPADLERLRNERPVLAQFHSVPRLGDWKALWDRADARYTIRQPAQEKEYDLPTLPNLIDPDEYRPIRRTGPVRIAFAPSSRAPIGLACSKGYREVREILNRVASQRAVEIEWIEGRPYEENLARKQRSHILIDDVVTGNFHRTSLEGACFGCAVVNKIRRTPFVAADLKTLERRLLWLVDSPGTLELYQEQARAWILSAWHPIEGTAEYVKAYHGAAR